jgi:SAM-dependent methyltransferase
MHGKEQDPKPQSADSASKDAQPHRVDAAAGHWRDIARLWEQVGPPLRPSTQDTAFLTDAIDSWARDNGAPRMLILGVTPELYRLPWPNGTDVLAVDHMQDMIDAIWPGPRNAIICAEWTNMPLQTGSRDIVLCDGGLNLLTYPSGHRQLVRTLHRVIASGGLCIFRLFVPPKKHETIDDVLQDLLEAKIPNLNLLKIRLWMALHKNITQGVQLKRVWDAIHRVAPDFNRVASTIGWPLEHLLVINTYRNCSARYFFLSLDDVRHLFCESPGGFTLEAVHVPTYELGELCPTVVLRYADTVGCRDDSYPLSSATKG